MSALLVKFITFSIKQIIFNSRYIDGHPSAKSNIFDGINIDIDSYAEHLNRQLIPMLMAEEQLRPKNYFKAEFLKIMSSES